MFECWFYWDYIKVEKKLIIDYLYMVDMDVGRNLFFCFGLVFWGGILGYIYVRIVNSSCLFVVFWILGIVLKR